MPPHHQCWKIIPLMQCRSSRQEGASAIPKPMHVHKCSTNWSVTLNEPVGVTKLTVFHILKLTWHGRKTLRRASEIHAAVGTHFEPLLLSNTYQSNTFSSYLCCSFPCAPSCSVRCLNSRLSSCYRPPSRHLSSVLSYLRPLGASYLMAKVLSGQIYHRLLWISTTGDLLCSFHKSSPLGFKAPGDEMNGTPAAWREVSQFAGYPVKVKKK